jgi:hypothetical protein
MSDPVTLATAAAPSQQSAPAQAPVTPGSPEWGALTAEQRHSQLRGAENPRARGHSPARDYWEEVAARATGQPPAQAQADPQAPQASAEKVKIGKFETSEAELGEMLERQAADD